MYKRQDIATISVLYQLAETTFHEFVAEYLIRQQRMLFSGKQRHRIGSKFAPDIILDNSGSLENLYKQIEELLKGR